MRCGVRGVILILALAPAALISSSLIAYFAYTRIHDMDHALAARGGDIVANLAPAAEFSVFSGNRAALDQLAHAVLRSADLAQIVILDRDGRVLVDQRAGVAVPSDEGVRWFEAPIHHTLIAVDDLGAFQARRNTRAEVSAAIGAVRVALSRTGTLQRQWEVFWIGVSALLVSLVIATGIGLYVGGRIYRPIRRVSNAFQALAQGDLDLRLPERSPWELGDLERGLNLAARALDRSRHVLQDQVRSATIELRSALRRLESQNAELERAHQAALQANAAQSRFLSSMSHEIRTPLHGVIASADLLARTRPLRRRQLDQVTTIHHSALLLLNLVNNLLDLSKIEATGDLPLGATDFDMPALFRQIVRVMAPEARAKRVRLTLAIDPALPRWVRGDPTRLGQILMNLVGNAVRFTERGSVIVSARVAAPPPATDQDEEVAVRCEVADTGIGIAPEALDRIFEGFVQARAPGARDYGGTGLGLAIAKRLVERMGGRIGVRSAPGVGSCFWFELLFRRAAVPDPGAETAAGPAGSPRRRAARPLRILVAEDHRMNRQVIRNILSSAGHRLHLVADGQAALDALRGPTPFDLALLDLQMPKLYGDEVIARYRHDHPGQSLPAILLTADATPAAEAAAQAVGIDAYLTKPISVDALLDTVERVVGPPVSAIHRLPDPSQPGLADTTGGRAPAAPRAASARGVLRPDLLNRMGQMRSPAVVPAIVQTFIREAERDLERLRKAAESKDWEALKEAVHLLKGAAATLGADRLADRCAAVGYAAARSDPVALQAEIQGLPGALAELIERLNPYLPRD